jgi:hypothetical protein
MPLDINKFLDQKIDPGEFFRDDEYYNRLPCYQVKYEDKYLIFLVDRKEVFKKVFKKQLSHEQFNFLIQLLKKNDISSIKETLKAYKSNNN